MLLLAFGIAGNARSQTSSDAVETEETEETIRFSVPVLNRPFDLAFTAVDGRRVDLREMKGKVVLLYFWIAEHLPRYPRLAEVVALGEKFSADGLVIVGVSLDRKKEVLEEVTSEESIDWPQYCDGMSWKSPISTQLGIKKVAAIWLVDRNGVLREQDVRLGGKPLEDKVRSLLKGL